MRMIVKETENEGLVSLLGQRVTLYCCRYIYTGDLVGVNDTCVKLKNVGIVYETGSYTEKEWQDYQKFPNDEFYVATQSIESFGILK